MKPPAHSDRALGDSVEMRHSVTTASYIFRRMFDSALSSFSTTKDKTVASLGPLLSRTPFAPGEPSGWIPLYTMVTFRPDISYATARKKAARQDRLVINAGWAGTVFLGITGIGFAWVTLSHRLRNSK